MSEKKTIQAVQWFAIDQITESSDGPLVAIKLYMDKRKTSPGQPPDIEFALPLPQAIAMGEKVQDAAKSLLH